MFENVNVPFTWLMFHVNGLSVVHVKLVKYVVEVAFESN